MTQNTDKNTKEVITAKSTNKNKKAEPQVVGPVNDGMIGVATKQTASKSFVPKKSAAVEKKTLQSPKKESVAIYSERNMTWGGVGKIYRGYNIVTQEEADKWLTRPQCRVATPEEVAKEFGVK